MVIVIGFRGSRRDKSHHRRPAAGALAGRWSGAVIFTRSNLQVVDANGWPGSSLCEGIAEGVTPVL